MRIVVNSGRAYLPWAATTIRSILDRHDPSALAFDMLNDETPSEADLGRLESMITMAGSSVRFHRVRDPRIDVLPSFGASRVTWFRLMVPHVLADVPRALLIDADTLVIDDLEPLWTTELGDSLFGAVVNVVEPSRHSHVRSFGLDPRSYLNAGVLLLDLDALRREDATGRLLAFAKENADRVSWFDQDCLNIVFAGRWKHLHPRWNAMNSLWTWADWAIEVLGSDAVREATTQPAVLHFEGPSVSKPWHYLSPHPWRRQYRDTLARTPWGNQTRLEDDTPVVRLISVLPERLRFPAYWRWLKVRNRLSR